MSILKKLSAVLVCASIALSLTACGESTTWGARINDTELKAGIYIYYSMDSYYDATSKLEEGVTDVFSATIDGKNGEQWIMDNATLKMQEYVAVEEKFNELGLTLSDEDVASVKNFSEQMWQYYGQVYEDFGISKDTNTDISINGLKKEAIFDYYYNTDGIEEVPMKDVENYISENDAYINYIKMDLKDGEGNLLKSDGKAEVEKMANNYIERAKNGEDFNALNAEYTAYYAKLVADAKAKQEADNSETNTIEATESTAQSDGTTDTTPTDTSTVITKDSTTPSAAVVSKVFDGSLSFGDVVLIKEDEVYYVVSYMNILDKEGYVDSEKKTVLHALKDEEFDTIVTSWTDDQNVEINEKAYKRYDARKFVSKETKASS